MPPAIDVVGDRLDARHGAASRARASPAHRREAEPAVADDDRGDAVPAGERAGTGPRRAARRSACAGRRSPARRCRPPASSDASASVRAQAADRRDAAVRDADVGAVALLRVPSTTMPSLMTTSKSAMACLLSRRRPGRGALHGRRRSSKKPERRLRAAPRGTGEYSGVRAPGPRTGGAARAAVIVMARAGLLLGPGGGEPDHRADRFSAEFFAPQGVRTYRVGPALFTGSSAPRRTPWSTMRHPITTIAHGARARPSGTSLARAVIITAGGPSRRRHA